MTTTLTDRMAGLIKEAVIKAFDKTECVELTNDQITIQNTQAPFKCNIKHPDYAFGADVVVDLEDKDVTANLMIVPVCITRIEATFPYKWVYIPLVRFTESEERLHDSLADLLDEKPKQ